MGAVRRDYKDSLFRHLFGDEARKANALELYNALAGTSYTDPDALQLTTIEDSIFLGFKNDVSFIVGDEMMLVEHQSTHNPNMPLRGLHYFAQLYAKLAEAEDLDMYSTSLVPLPTPRYVVLYFGERDRPDREVMALSDSFGSGPGDLEVTATVLNCNEGRNAAIMEACGALRGYAHLLALARENRRAGMNLQLAVRTAVDSCAAGGELADYLAAHRTEAEYMLFTIQDEERAMRVHWKAVEREAREAGLEQGLKEGREQGLEQGLKEGREQGIEQGFDQGIELISAKLRDLGVDETIIARAASEARAKD